MRKYLRYLLIALVTLVFSLVQIAWANPPQPTPTQRIVMYSKPAVVRVVDGCLGSYFHRGKYYLYSYGGQGSGFFINPQGYIATRTVSGDEAQCKDRLFKRLASDLYNNEGVDVDKEGITKDKLLEFEPYSFVILPTARTVPFEVKSNFTDNKDVSIIKVELGKDSSAPSLKFASSNEVKISDEAITIGYPILADVPVSKDTNTTEDFRTFFGNVSTDEASVIEGKVSNPNKIKNGVSILQLNMQTLGYGSAGSPVLNNQGEVVGMLASTEADTKVINWLDDREDKIYKNQDVVPSAITTATIQEFVQESGTVNEQALLDEYYRQGLELYWKGDYAGAKERFEAVQGLFPYHSEIGRLISESNKYNVEKSFRPEILLWSVLGGIILGLLGLVLYLTQRKPRVVNQFVSPQPERRSRPPITGFPASNGVGQSWIELEGQGQRSELQLTRETHKIGRDPAWSDIEIPTSWEVLSRQHALLKREGSSYRIFDGDGKVPSRNGLMINSYSSVDVHEGYLLKPGDVLIIGKDPREQVRLSYYSSTANQVVPETKMAK